MADTLATPSLRSNRRNQRQDILNILIAAKRIERVNDKTHGFFRLKSVDDVPPVKIEMFRSSLMFDMNEVHQDLG